MKSLAVGLFLIICAILLSKADVESEKKLPDQEFKDLHASLLNLARLYSDPVVQKSVADTAPLVYVFQKGLETADLSLCYGVLEKIRGVYKSAEPYASGFLLTLTKQFVSESDDLLQKRAGKKDLQDFVVSAVAGMKEAESQL